MTNSQKSDGGGTNRSSIDLQPPPYVQSVDIAKNRQIRADIVTKGERKLHVFLEEFDSRNAQLVYTDGESGEKKTALFREIKALQLNVPYVVDAVTRKNGGELDKQEADNYVRPFHILFNDGSEANGYTLGTRLDHNGVHFYRQSKKVKHHYFHLFVPHYAIREYVVDEKLGQILVKDGSVSAEGLGEALNILEEKRKSKLGDYLVSNNIVNADDLRKALDRQKHMPNLRLGEILIEEKLITRPQLESILTKHIEDARTPLGKILVDKGFITREQLQKSLAKKLGIPVVNLRDFIVDSDVIAKMPTELSRKYRVFPLYEFEGNLVVAMENPLDWEVQNIIRFATGKNIDPVMAARDDISWALEFYLSDAEISEGYEFFDELEAEGVAEKDYTESQEEEVASNIIVRIVNKIILDAYNQKASDIHIEPDVGNNLVRIRFRKDGALTKYHDFPMRFRSELVSRVKVMANLDVTKRFSPQDGKISFKYYSDTDLELRVATLPTAGHQEDIVMRLLHSGKIFPISSIGLNEWSENNVLDLTSRPHGLFLVCGPTGSGKTTTLHSVLNHLNTEDKKIWTAEDPVEITQSGLRQVAINQNIGLTFARVLRAFLRADPDIIMIGEIRDVETANIAIESSLTGHLVLSTLHTNSAAETLIRLLEMGMDEFNLADALLGVISQRLLKTLCATCKSSYRPDHEELKQLALEYCRESTTQKYIADKDLEKQINTWKELYFRGGDILLHRPSACSECGDTGYKGRIGVYELLVVTPEIKKLIMRKAPSNDLLVSALSHGMTTIKQDGIMKVIQGYTDLRQVRIL